ncbi:MAG TPA: glycosyltransferase family 4 protein [Verrucomicrobiae bacterium]|nr:glycosyltransferase family 4 protein [Verrucomicrobiae bacterium]
MTASRNREDLTRAKAEGLVPSNLRFVYVGERKEWYSNRLLARLQLWYEFIRYAKQSLQVAKELHRAENFDLVQHVTFATWRVPSPLWQLGIPFVFGPIGGNEQFPFRFFPVLSPAGAAFELLRKTSNVVSRYSPRVRRGIAEAAHVFAATTETEQLVKSIRGSDQGVTRLLPGFYSASSVAAFSRFVSGKNLDGVLRLFASGNLGGHKNLGLALSALSQAKRRGVKFHFYLGANGPEIPHLKELVAKLDLEAEVYFGDTMSREEYQRELGNTHVYLLPSLRESVGLTMMEAMLAGCVPVVADCGGPNFIVTPDCGYKIAVSNPNRMAAEITEVIVAIDRDRTIIAEKGTLASRRIAMHFTEDNYRREVNAVYAAVTMSPGKLPRNVRSRSGQLEALTDGSPMARTRDG